MDSTGEDAVQRFQDATGIPVISLMTLAGLEQAMVQTIGSGEGGGVEESAASKNSAPPGLEVLEQIRAYRRRYGAQRSTAGMDP